MSEIFSKQLQKLIEGYDEHCKQLEKKTKLNYSHRTPQERRDYRNWLEEDYVRWFEEMFPQYAKKSLVRGFTVKWQKNSFTILFVFF